MNHPDPKVLDDYVDGVLLMEEVQALEEHLEACAECRAAVLARQDFMDAVADGLTEHLQAQSPGPRSMRFAPIAQQIRHAAPQGSRLPSWTMRAVGAAAAVVLFAAGAWTSQQFQQRAVTDGPTLFGAGAVSPAAPTMEPLLPDGWQGTSSVPGEYTMGMVPGREGGKASAIASAVEAPTGFGALTQVVSAQNYQGQRLRLRAHLATVGVQGWAGLWMRVDGPSGQPLSFDNMQGRPVVGSTGWTQHDVVLDVPPQARAIAFGTLLAGSGAAWLDDIELTAVDQSVPTTDSLNAQRSLPQTPVNLDFEGQP